MFGGGGGGSGRGVGFTERSKAERAYHLARYNFPIFVRTITCVAHD